MADHPLDARQVGVRRLSEESAASLRSAADDGSTSIDGGTDSEADSPTARQPEAHEALTNPGIGAGPTFFGLSIGPPPENDADTAAAAAERHRYSACWYHLELWASHAADSAPRIQVTRQALYIRTQQRHDACSCVPDWPIPWGWTCRRSRAGSRRCGIAAHADVSERAVFVALHLRHYVKDTPPWRTHVFSCFISTTCLAAGATVCAAAARHIHIPAHPGWFSSVTRCNSSVCHAIYCCTVSMQCVSDAGNATRRDRHVHVAQHDPGRSTGRHCQCTGWIRFGGLITS